MADEWQMNTGMVQGLGRESLSRQPIGPSASMTLTLGSGEIIPSIVVSCFNSYGI